MEGVTNPVCRSLRRPMFHWASVIARLVGGEGEMSGRKSNGAHFPKAHPFRNLEFAQCLERLRYASLYGLLPAALYRSSRVDILAFNMCCLD